MFSVFIDPCLMLHFAFSAHSDLCLPAGDVTGESQYKLPLFISKGDRNTDSVVFDFSVISFKKYLKFNQIQGLYLFKIFRYLKLFWLSFQKDF